MSARKAKHAPIEVYGYFDQECNIWRLCIGTPLPGTAHFVSKIKSAAITEWSDMQEVKFTLNYNLTMYWGLNYHRGDARGREILEDIYNIAYDESKKQFVYLWN